MSLNPFKVIKAAVANRLTQLYPDILVFEEQIQQHLGEKNFVLYTIPGMNRKVTPTRHQITGTLDIAYIIRDDSNEEFLKKEFEEKFITISTQVTNVEFQNQKIRFIDFTTQEADRVLHIMSSFELQVEVVDKDG